MTGAGRDAAKAWTDLMVKGVQGYYFGTGVKRALINVI